MSRLAVLIGVTPHQPPQATQVKLPEALPAYPRRQPSHPSPRGSHAAYPLGIEVVEARGSTRAPEREGELVRAEALANPALLVAYQYRLYISHLTFQGNIYLLNYLIHHTVYDLLNQSLRCSQTA